MLNIFKKTLILTVVSMSLIGASAPGSATRNFLLFMNNITPTTLPIYATNSVTSQPCSPYPLTLAASGHASISCPTSGRDSITIKYGSTSVYTFIPKPPPSSQVLANCLIWSTTDMSCAQP